MITRVPLLFAAFLVTGCVSNDYAFADRNMMLDSEDCRERAQADALSTAVGNGQTFDARQVVFDHSYEACMATKGMPVKHPGS